MTRRSERDKRARDREAGIPQFSWMRPQATVVHLPELFLLHHFKKKKHDAFLRNNNLIMRLLSLLYEEC